MFRLVVFYPLTIKHISILTYLLIYYYCTCIVFIGILSVSDVSLLKMAKVYSRNVEWNKECNKDVYSKSCVIDSDLHWNTNIFYFYYLFTFKFIRNTLYGTTRIDHYTHNSKEIGKVLIEIYVV